MRLHKLFQIEERNFCNQYNVDDITKAMQKKSLLSNTIELHNTYELVFTDNTIKHPFAITSELALRAKFIREHSQTDLICAVSLFDYLCKHITYEKRRGYRSGKEVWNERKGVCGEMSFLYIGMARSVGFKSSYVGVTIDNDGESVRHACAGVFLQRLYLVDIAYKRFDIKHKAYKINSDLEVFKKFEAWN